MMNIKAFFKYQRGIWSGAFSKFKEKNLGSEIVKNLFIEIPVSIIASVFLFKDNEPAIIAFLTIGFLIVINLLWFICFLLFEPVNLFVENSKKINELIPEDPFELKILPPYRKKPNSVWVGFEILNKSLQTTHFIANIKIDQMEKNESLDPLLEHGTRDSYTPIEISGETEYPFYFACSGINWENAVLNTKKEPHRKIMPGKHEIQVLINGHYILNNKAVLHKEEFLLFFDGDDNLRLEKI